MAKFFSPLYSFLFILSINLYTSSATTSYNVLSFGAKGNGVTDSTQAFTGAWAAACKSSESSMIYVPKGRYLLGSMVFQGKNCTSSYITLRIDGTLVAPVDYRVLSQVENWLSFEWVNGVAIIGGSFDAKGTSLWSCKDAGTNCPEGATTLRFSDSKNIKINGLLSLNSQLFHIAINRCENVNVKGVRIIADGNSPNTDGIHVQLSTKVMITNTSIKTGDDCISIGPGTKNLLIDRVTCGPGHGISIGSLAKDLVEEGVQNVTIMRTILAGTTNGLRIKSWARPSTGYVQNVRFLGILMQNVKNPIFIDQNYCPGNLNCPDEVSGVEIRDVTYQNIRGTSATPIAIKMDCSIKYPCKGIVLQNVKLTYLSNQVAQSSCTNVIGKALGLVLPDTCL